MIYRKALIEEIPILCEIRKKQLIDEGIEPKLNMDKELKNFFEEKMSDGSMIEYVAEENGEIIATAAVIFYDFPPCFTNKSGKKAYIANVYTAPSFRCRGIATEMLKRLAEEAKARNVSEMWLEASKFGRPVYEKFGFKDMDKYMEMKI